MGNNTKYQWKYFADQHQKPTPYSPEIAPTSDREIQAMRDNSRMIRESDLRTLNDGVESINLEYQERKVNDAYIAKIKTLNEKYALEELQSFSKGAKDLTLIGLKYWNIEEQKKAIADYSGPKGVQYYKDLAEYQRQIEAADGKEAEIEQIKKDWLKSGGGFRFNQMLSNRSGVYIAKMQELRANDSALMIPAMIHDLERNGTFTLPDVLDITGKPKQLKYADLKGSYGLYKTEIDAQIKAQVLEKLAFNNGGLKFRPELIAKYFHPAFKQFYNARNLNDQKLNRAQEAANFKQIQEDEVQRIATKPGGSSQEMIEAWTLQTKILSPRYGGMKAALDHQLEVLAKKVGGKNPTITPEQADRILNGQWTHPDGKKGDKAKKHSIKELYGNTNPGAIADVEAAMRTAKANQNSKKDVNYTIDLDDIALKYRGRPQSWLNDNMPSIVEELKGPGNTGGKTSLELAADLQDRILSKRELDDAEIAFEWSTRIGAHPWSAWQAQVNNIPGDPNDKNSVLGMLVEQGFVKKDGGMDQSTAKEYVKGVYHKKHKTQKGTGAEFTGHFISSVERGQSFVNQRYDHWIQSLPHTQAQEAARADFKKEVEEKNFFGEKPVDRSVAQIVSDVRSQITSESNSGKTADEIIQGDAVNAIWASMEQLTGSDISSYARDQWMSNNRPLIHAAASLSQKNGNGGWINARQLANKIWQARGGQGDFINASKEQIAEDQQFGENNNNNTPGEVTKRSISGMNPKNWGTFRGVSPNPEDNIFYYNPETLPNDESFQSVFGKPYYKIPKNQPIGDDVRNEFATFEGIQEEAYKLGMIDYGPGGYRFITDTSVPMINELTWFVKEHNRDNPDNPVDLSPIRNLSKLRAGKQVPGIEGQSPTAPKGLTPAVQSVLQLPPNSPLYLALAAADNPLLTVSTTKDGIGLVQYHGTNKLPDFGISSTVKANNLNITDKFTGETFWLARVRQWKYIPKSYRYWKYGPDGKTWEELTDAEREKVIKYYEQTSMEHKQVPTVGGGS